MSMALLVCVVTPLAAARGDDVVDPVAALLSKSLPAGAQEIAAALKVAKAGETVTIRGRVAPSRDAFADGRAVATIVDESAAPNRFPPPRELPATLGDFPANAKATIQFVDANGRPLSTKLAGQHGLAPGAEVFVTGNVVVANGVDALVVNVATFHVPRGPLPVGFFVDAPIEGARDVSDLRAKGGIKVGDEVVLRGRIGGGKEPFVAGRAMVTLMGARLKPCNENPDDACKTPWDVCCDPKELIRANTATVQIVDAKGQPLRTDLKGRRGVKELSDVIVRGKVTAVDGAMLVVDATAMSVVKP